MNTPVTCYCSICAYWENMDGTFGYCRRHAPSLSTGTIPVDTRGNYACAWPVTSNGDWCGEAENKGTRAGRAGDNQPLDTL